MERKTIGGSNVVACIWDFDKTLAPDYMQAPLFEEYGLDLRNFWNEVNTLPKAYGKYGVTVSDDSIAMNHLLTYIQSGLLPGLNNQKLFSFGERLKFFPGLPDFFSDVRKWVDEDQTNKKYHITLEHYIISNGFAQMIRGSKIAGYVDGIYGCEFIETPLPPNFLQDKVEYSPGGAIQQIGRIIDNTQKTRCIFEINKGCNKDDKIDINSAINEADRRVPLNNMIYIADGPSDIPAFTVIRGGGGYAYAVYNEQSEAEFEQNDHMLADGRIDSYGPANYTAGSQTVRWIKMKIKHICARIIQETDAAICRTIGEPPTHIHEDIEEKEND